MVCALKGSVIPFWHRFGIKGKTDVALMWQEGNVTLKGNGTHSLRCRGEHWTGIGGSGPENKKPDRVSGEFGGPDIRHFGGRGFRVSGFSGFGFFGAGFRVTRFSDFFSIF